ncbi:MAG: hypothetical protein ACHQ4J_00105 [Candidatus Binatia bacterium]
MLSVKGRKIERMSVIDDDPTNRDGYSLFVEELSMQPLSEDGPFSSVPECVARVLNSAHAAISDFKLRVSNYATFNGAELVASLYEKHVPAILCTRFEWADIDQIRPFRARIPSLLRPDELDAESLAGALEKCIEEFRSEFAQTRRPWKALVRIEDIHDEPGQGTSIDVCVPTWNNNVMIRLRESELPDSMRARLKQNARVYADVNLGAERPEELYFVNWSES